MKPTLVNPLIKGQKLTLDKERTLLYNNLALWKIQEATGLNYFKGGFKDLVEDPTPERLAILIWAGLIHEDPELTKEQVAAMLPVRGAGKLLLFAIETMQLSDTRTEAEKAEEAEAAAHDGVENPTLATVPA